MSAHPLDTFDSFPAPRSLPRTEELQAQYGIADTEENTQNSTLWTRLEHRLSEPEHLQRMTQIAHKQTRYTNVDWQDALQTAQLKLLKGLRAGKFTGSLAEFDRWALTVARFAIIDLVRSSTRQPTQSIDRLSEEHGAILDTLTSFDDGLANIEAADLVWQVRQTVLQLDRQYPTRSYHRLWLGKVQDQTQAEIAQDLGLSQGTISKRWRELIAHLALELGVDLAVDQTSANAAKNRSRSPQQW